MIMRQKIAVTGASGQLGLALKNLSPAYPQFEFDFLAKEKLSITDEAGLLAYFKMRSPQYLINCAAYTAVDKAEEEKELAFALNCEAMKNLALVCKKNNTRLVHISTDYVFDGEAKQPYAETARTNPVNVYGESKLEGEKQAILYNPDSIIIRTSWVYSTTGKNFVRTMVRLMKERTELKIVNDQFGSPTYAPDLAQAILQIIFSQQWIPGIYHFSNEGAITWYEFALAIKELTGSTCKISPISRNDYPAKAKRPLFSILDKQKIQAVYRIELKNWRLSLRNCLLDLDSK